MIQANAFRNIVWAIYFVLLVNLTVAESLLADLPKELTKVIKKQKEDFHRVFSPLNDEQRKIVVDRYVRLTLESEFTKEMVIDEKEMRVFLESVIQESMKNPVKKRELEKYPEQMERDIALLLEKFSGTRKNDIINLLFKCENDNLKIPFETNDEGEEWSLNLHGVPVVELDVISSDSRCLRIVIHKNRLGDLDWVGTSNAACPIPERRGGTCLLEIADEIGSALKLRSLALLDFSKVRCTKNRKETSLRHLKIFQEGQGWYEKRGYKVKGQGSRSYSDQMKIFTSYKLETLLSEIAEVERYFDKETLQSNRAKEFLRRSDFINKRIRKFLLDKKGDTVASFMSWLWEENCEDYMRIEEVLFDSTTQLPFNKAYPDEHSFVKEFD